MAERLDSEFGINVGTTEVEILTVAAGKSMVVTGIIVANVHTLSSIKATIGVRRGGTYCRQGNAIHVPVNVSLTPPIKLNLRAGDKLVVIADIADACDVTVSFLELDA